VLHADGGVTVEPYGGPRPADDLAAYSLRRADEWGALYADPDRPISSEEIVSYFATLQRRNRHLLRDFSKTIRLTAASQVWTVRLGELAEDFVIEGEEPYDPQYSLLMPGRVLRAILDNRTGWEEALLSMRVRLQRNPDVFDSRLIGLLRYGNEPVQTLQMAREAARTETVERDGIRHQRFCPHAGEDLSFATICDGVIECPRHHWKWDLRTGECLEGGNLPLRVETPCGAKCPQEAPAV
jgi:UDP-MurNAc hydroxylase